MQALKTTFGNLTDSINSYGFNMPACDFVGSDSYQYAKTLKADVLFQINTSLQSYYDIISDGPISNEKPSSQTSRHLKKFLTKFGLNVTERVLTDITDECLVEVYSLSHQQLYRSVNFFNVSSYDIGNLTFSPWDKLFHRAEENTAAVFKAINFVIDNNLEYHSPKVPLHFLTEIGSGNKFGYKLLKLATVADSDQGDTMGYLSIISAKKVLGEFQVIQ